MAPYIPVENTCMAELRYTWAGENCENVTYWQGVVGFQLEDMENLADALTNWWQVFMRPLCSNTLELREVYITDLSTQTGPTLSWTNSLPDAGTITDESMPNNTAFVVSFRTAGRGRSSRGRNYVPGATTNNVTHNTFATAYRNAVLAAYNQLNDTSFLAGWAQVVVSKYTNKQARPTGLRQLVQTAVATSDKVKSMRTRLPE